MQRNSKRLKNMKKTKEKGIAHIGIERVTSVGGLGVLAGKLEEHKALEITLGELHRN